MATAHSQFSIEKGDVKNAFLSGTFDDVPHGELAAKPVRELRKALNLRDDDVVMLTKACYGLIDAPRRWWMSLVRDSQQLVWRSCRHELCLMTCHVRGRLKGLMCFHVDDIMISDPAKDPEFRRMMDKVNRLSEWSEWERHEFDQCGCRVQQATDKSITFFQEAFARKHCLSTMSAHRCKHMSETMSEEEHTELAGNTIHESVVNTFESHRNVEKQPQVKVSRI